MALQNASPTPTELNLNRKTRSLEVAFDNGTHFSLPCEYLRVFSPAAEVKVARKKGEWLTEKTWVNIERITPVGNYAVQIMFDDSHDTGVYSWQTLYELGRDQNKNWALYCRESQRSKPAQGESTDTTTIQILYFATLVSHLGLESEQVNLPSGVDTVSRLLAWLRERGEKWSKNLHENKVTITVNKQFAQPETRIKGASEVAITPIYASGPPR